MFRYPEMAVGLKENCHDFDPLWSSQAVIEYKAGAMLEFQTKIEVFNLTKLMGFIELMVARSKLEDDLDSEGKNILTEYYTFEENVRNERTAEEFDNAELKLEKAYIEREALNAFDNSTISGVNDDAKPAIREVLEELFVQLKEGQRKNNNIGGGRPTFDKIMTVLTEGLGKIQGAMGRRRRNILLV